MLPARHADPCYAGGFAEARALAKARRGATFYVGENVARLQRARGIFFGYGLCFQAFCLGYEADALQAAERIGQPLNARYSRLRAEP